MNGDRPFLGILLMLGFCVLAPLGDGIAKILGSVISVGAMVMIRFGAQAAILLPISIVAGLPIPQSRRLIQLIAIRTVLHIVGIGMMFTALKYLPLADALAIAFVMPFLLLLGGWLFANETVGAHRLGACAVGFVGTLLVIQPNFTAVGWPALLPLGVAVSFVGFIMVTRAMAKEIDPIAMQAVSGIIALTFLLPATFLLPTLDILSFDGVGKREIFLIIALGTLGTFAHLLMTWSLRFAPSATLAPIQYIEIPFGAVIGFILFDDLPNGLAALGIAITIAAGLYIVMRERSLTSPEPDR